MVASFYQLYHFAQKFLLVMFGILFLLVFGLKGFLIYTFNPIVIVLFVPFRMNFTAFIKMFIKIFRRKSFKNPLFL